ncbi:hypothetical protein [Burkholderia gladioli]|uniref:hypothetical protein n=1 Tax=Burkholderia gladioli TaxID=28095 RepID=UPI001FC85C55|nr:hypothetical protein [Burkholderia gladioli]
MKTSVEYLDAVKARLDLPSDYATAKVLGLTRAAVSKQRSGQSAFDDLTAVRVAEILGIDPIEVIAAANAERARDDDARRTWERLWGKATGAVATAVLAAGVITAAAPSTAKASETPQSASLRIMSNYMESTHPCRALRAFTSIIGSENAPQAAREVIGAAANQGSGLAGRCSGRVWRGRREGVGHGTAGWRARVSDRGWFRNLPSTAADRGAADNAR